MIRVTTGSRLHFGLLRLPPPGPWPAGQRYYGGAGLMIERPGVRVAVAPAGDWAADGPLAARALDAARRCAAAVGGPATPHRVLVEACAPEHRGLGTGTQLALAVAAALHHSWGLPPPPTVELARRAGRGLRSGVGVHGFAHGGFLVDGGKAAPEGVAPLVARLEFPAAWRVVLLTPAGGAGWHGAREAAALAAAESSDPALAELLLLGVLPALAEANLAAFGEALHEYNARAAQPFRAAQGGTYASPATAEAVAWLRQRGVRGAGQSSWGPTAYGVVGDAEEAEGLTEDATRRWGAGLDVLATAAAPSARTERLTAV